MFNCHPDNDTGNLVTEPLSRSGRQLRFRYFGSQRHATLCFGLCLCPKGYFYSRVLKELGYSSYLFVAIWKDGPFYHVVLGVSFMFFLSCGAGVSIRFVLYSLFRSMFLMVIFSVCFDFSFVVYVCNRFSR
jgi:hypothetical protein